MTAGVSNIGKRVPRPAWLRKNMTEGTSGMPCPECGGKTGVTDSRPFHGALKRHRVCLSCDLRFRTFERVEGAEDIRASEYRALRPQLIALAEQILERLGCPVCEPDREAAE
jgi:hypothetical protein